MSDFDESQRKKQETKDYERIDDRRKALKAILKYTRSQAEKSSKTTEVLGVIYDVRTPIAPGGNPDWRLSEEEKAKLRGTMPDSGENGVGERRRSQIDIDEEEKWKSEIDKDEEERWKEDWD